MSSPAVFICGSTWKHRLLILSCCNLNMTPKVFIYHKISRCRRKCLRLHVRRPVSFSSRLPLSLPKNTSFFMSLSWLVMSLDGLEILTLRKLLDLIKLFLSLFRPSLFAAMFKKFKQLLPENEMFSISMKILSMPWIKGCTGAFTCFQITPHQSHQCQAGKYDCWTFQLLWTQLQFRSSLNIITEVLCDSYLRESLYYIAQIHLRSGMCLLHKQSSDVIIGRDFAVMTSFLTDMSIKVVISWNPPDTYRRFISISISPRHTVLF